MCRILSLDGGGIRGILSADILSRLEKEETFLSHVDLFAGTSTGAILAISLAFGSSPEDCAELYLNSAPLIFKSNLWEHVTHLRETLTPKYSNENLKQVLEQKFGDLTFSECKRPVVITCFDAGCDSGQWKPCLLCSWKPESRNIKIVELLL